MLLCDDSSTDLAIRRIVRQTKTKVQRFSVNDVVEVLLMESPPPGLKADTLEGGQWLEVHMLSTKGSAGSGSSSTVAASGSAGGAHPPTRVMRFWLPTVREVR